MSGELASERWSPAQRVESVLLSIVSLLDDAECSSPANVDAGVMLRKQPNQFKELVKADVEASKKDVPEGFVMPESGVGAVHQPEKHHDDRDFWYDSEEDNDFGGSDTDEEDMTQEEVDEMDVDDDEEEEDEGGEGYTVHEEEEEL